MKTGNRVDAGTWLGLALGLTGCVEKAAPEPTTERAPVASQAAEAVPKPIASSAPKKAPEAANQAAAAAATPAAAPGDPHAGKFSIDDATKDLPGSGKLIADIATDAGTLECELYADKAPITVANFVGLARGTRAWKKDGQWVNKPLYDGTVFHRVIKGFMIQGGDPNGNGSGGPRVGASTLKALRDLDAGAHWALAGAKGERAAGNGAAMRIAPLAFHLDPADAEQRQLIRDVCRITHHHDEAYAGALAVLAAIRWLAFDQTATPSKLCERALIQLPDSRVKDRLSELNSLPHDFTVMEVARRYGSSGYVAESVPLALYAARLIDGLPLKVVLRNAIEAGGDTDTIASITGQIAGTWIGASRIPVELSRSLRDAHYLNEVIDQFADTINES
jgi:ADP-ribosylglycohydrolase